jgi:hypothetical protein
MVGSAAFLAGNETTLNPTISRVFKHINHKVFKRNQYLFREIIVELSLNKREGTHLSALCFLNQFSILSPSIILAVADYQTSFGIMSSPRKASLIHSKWQ